MREQIVQGVKLVIIDTTSRFLGSADQMDNADMTRLLGALQRLAIEHQAAIVLVDHHRKSARTSPDTDPIDDILGSTAKAGVVDCALGLYRRHNEDEATLKLSGRDFGDQEIALVWDPATFRWSAKPPAAGARPIGLHPARAEAVDAVAELGHATLTQLVAHTRPGQEQPLQPPPKPDPARPAPVCARPKRLRIHPPHPTHHRRPTHRRPTHRRPTHYRPTHYRPTHYGRPPAA